MDLHSSVQFSCSVVSDSLQTHELYHARPPCPTPTPGAHPNSCPLSRWCHPTISSSVFHLSFNLQSFPASGSFQMSQFFTSGGQSIGVSSLEIFPALSLNKGCLNSQQLQATSWRKWAVRPEGTQEGNKEYLPSNTHLAAMLFKLWCWRRLFTVTWRTRRSN